MNLQTKEDYTETKKLLKDLTWKRDNMRGSDSFTQHMKMHVSLLEAVLLAYRRANNIFQEGDAIVRRWNNRVYWIITDIDNGSEFMINENKNAKFKDCKVCDMPCNFTFATDAEIKAGRRL